MSNKQKIFILLLCIGVGFLVGYNTPRTSWETKYIPVEYDIPKNTQKCKDAGGDIEIAPVYVTNSKKVHARFVCVISQKTFDTSDATTTVEIKMF